MGNIVLCSWLPEWFRNAEGRPLINEQWGFGISIAGAIGIYIIASLLEKSLKHEPDFNLDKMLHRGRYADSQSAKPATGLRALGFTDEFTRGDKFIFFAGIGWTILWFLVGVTLLVLEYTGVMTTHRLGGILVLVCDRRSHHRSNHNSDLLHRWHKRYDPALLRFARRSA